MQSRVYVRSFSLIVGGIALSIALSLFAEGLMHMNTPGAYVVSRVFPQSAGGHPDIRLVVWLFEGTDFLLCFALLLVLYLLFAKLSTGGNNDPS
jgi:RsiW-degrading membrane proteinase PrsW (M82 family)